jgi:hypothetical protein
MSARLFFRLLFPFRAGFAVTITEFGFVAGLSVGATSGAFKKPFYEAAAQIIPVLLLVLAIEARYFRINLLSLSTLREKFEAEMKQMLEDDSSFQGMLRWSYAFQEGPVFRYIQQRALMALALGILVAGEVIAILILGQPSLGSKWLQGSVLGALFAGLGAVAVAALVGPMAMSVQQPEDAEETGT